jgi:hypothetical protein
MKEGGKTGQKSGKKKGAGKKTGEEGVSGAKNKGKNGTGGKAAGKKEGPGENNDLDGALYEIYKEQTQLRQQLQQAIKESGNGTATRNAKKVLKTMEQLENEILEKGFNAGTIQNMQQLQYELLKLDKAALEQGEDKTRKSISNAKEVQRNSRKALQFKKQFYNQIEILNRQSLPLQQNYKLKVREYFSESNNKKQ